MDELIIARIEAPLPPRYQPGGRPKSPAKAAVLRSIMALEVGQCMELNRTKKQCDKYTWLARQVTDRARRYLIRDQRPGWCRIWRRL